MWGPKPPLAIARYVLITWRGLHAGDLWPGGEGRRDEGAKLLLHGLALWFAASAALAWYYAAIKRDFATHQRFVYRHLAAGIWVSAQRVVLLLAAQSLSLIEGLLPAFAPGVLERAMFNATGMGTIAVSLAVTEWALHQQSSHRKVKAP